MDTEYIVVYGNVLIGFEFVGPFALRTKAEFYGETRGFEDFVIAEIHKPEYDE